MRRQFLIEGEVQGVGFRYFTVRAARRIGIRGWVRNLPDGGVEAVVEGTDDQLQEFEAALRRGPSMAIVTNVRASDVSDEVELPGSFQVR
jgi:acylphosphatase